MLSLQPIWVTFLISATASWILIFPVRQLLMRFGFVDRPNARSSHTVPILRGGGVAIVATTVGWLLLSRPAQPGVALPLLVLATVSFWDDYRPLAARLRFAVQSLAAMAALAWLWPASVNCGDWLAAISLSLAFLWITGYTNAFNFMDGINGLASGQAVVTALGSAWLGHAAGLAWTHPAIGLAAVIAGAAAGFLPHNFPRPRVFMGDAGSASLGFLLSVLVLWLARDAGWWLIIPLASLHGNFVLDTGLTLLRRIVNGEKWREAHREHFYQRLVRAGQSHFFVTTGAMLIQVAVLGLMVVYLSASPALQIILVCAVVVLWLGCFVEAERRFRSLRTTR